MREGRAADQKSHDLALDFPSAKAGVQLQFDCDSTANLQFDRATTIRRPTLRAYRSTCCGMLHCGLNK